MRLVTSATIAVMSRSVKEENRGIVSGPVVRPTDETPTRCFTNGYLRIQHDRGQCNGIGMKALLTSICLLDFVIL